MQNRYQVTWGEEETARLPDLWMYEPNPAVVLEHFPGRTWQSLYRKAQTMGLKRPRFRHTYHWAEAAFNPFPKGSLPKLPRDAQGRLNLNAIHSHLGNGKPLSPEEFVDGSQAGACIYSLEFFATRLEQMPLCQRPDGLYAHPRLARLYARQLGVSARVINKLIPEEQPCA